MEQMSRVCSIISPLQLSDRLAEVLAIDPSAPAVEFDGTWSTWAEIGAVATKVRDLIAASGADAPVAVGVVLTNRPEVVGAVIGVLLGGGCVVTLNPHQGDAGLTADVVSLRTPVVVARADDWARRGLRDAVADIGAAGIELLDDPALGARSAAGLEAVTQGDHRVPDGDVAVEMLTSGTTGPPKRIPLLYSAFEKTIAAAGAHYRTGASASEGPRLRSGVALVTSPFVHMSGIFRMLLNLCEGRRIALLDRFRVDDWVELVRRHRPRAVSLVPTALAMVYDADVPRDVFESVQVVTSGSAALAPDLQARFEERYGVAVLPSYGATEFAGGVAGWTLALHQEWMATKRGSVGRPQPGRELRVVDPESGEPRPSGEQGVLEVAGADGCWVRTTDLARIDGDGFVWIDGRTDDAILRGGFKVFPKEVVEVLRSHPAVADAGVVGLEDERLGAVPVAAVELRAGATESPEKLLAHAGMHLAKYKVPAELRIVEALPRTPSMKVSGPGVRALFEEE